MDNKKQKIIHINASDGIDLVIDKIRKCGEKEITLVLPENAMILQDLINLKILKMNAKELGKNISVAVIDDSEYAKINNKVNKIEKSEMRNQPSSLKDLIDRSEEENDNNKIDETAGMIDFKNNKPESKIKIYDIIKKREVPVDSEIKKITDASQELEEKYEENLLRQKRERFNQDNIEDEEDEEGMDINEISDLKKPKKQKRRISLLPSLSSGFFAGFIVVCLIITAAILAFVLPKSDLTITLKTEALTYDFEFVADELINKIDAISDKIPLEKIDITNEEIGDYPTTGKKHVTENATGKIIIYNECSTGPQTLVADTRFLSKEGKIFKITKSATIAGFTKPEDKVIPGSVAAEVVAEGSGESYNIGETSFTIPKLQELNSWKFSCLYARSEKPMSGGVDKDVLYFSDSDYLTAKEKLVKIAKEKNEKEFSDKISDKYLLLEYSKQEEEVKTENDTKVGDIVDSFQMTVSAKTTALLVVKSDFDDLISEKINLNLDHNIELVKESRKYEIGEVRKDENEKMSIPVSVSQNSIVKIDVDKIKNEIMGKNESELREYFINTKGIKAIDINFWPFWVKKIPSAVDKINVTIDINNSM